MGLSSALMLWGAETRAEADQAIVCLIAPGAHGPALLQESSLRVRAELRTAGFEVVGGDEGEGEGGETRECPVGSATISLEVTGNVLTIWAQVSEAHLPLSQAVDLTNQSDARAEVIAIRAVDGLRAAVLEAIVANQGVVSRPLAEFASARPMSPAPEKPEPAPTELKRAPVLEAERAEPYRGRSRASRRPAARQGGLATVIGFGPELAGGEQGVGLSFGASLDFWWKFVGVGLVADVALLGPVWETPTSRVSIHEYGFGVRGQAALCGRPFACQLGLGGSMRTVALDAIQTMDGAELLERGAHVSPVFDLGAGVGYWFADSVGVFAAGWLHLYGDAPRLIVGADESLWGRPSYTLSVGPWFRL